MERVCDSAGDGGGGDSSSSSSSSTAAYLKHLNKISHKISKPIRKPPGPGVYDTHTLQTSQLEPQQSQPVSAPVAQAAPPPQQQQQPPVYNINKSDFRDVVQKLTGSPAHERMSTPPPIHQPKPPSSRLQRIRPPPLVQISNRPSPLLTAAGPPLLLPSGGAFGLRAAPQPQPLSPLPPFPAVHAAAESPISAYMRFLHTSFTATATATAVDSDSKRFSAGLPPLAPLASPRWNTFAPPPPPPPPPASSATILPQFPAMPSSPLPFSCLPSPSPRSPCALLSPNLLLSPAGQLGFPQLPLSPTVPVPSPTWKGI